MTGARDEAYAALGLPPGAPFEEVRKRFLSLATHLHPDKAPGAVESAQFSAVRAAFEQIADVQRSAQPAAEAPSKPTHKACGAAAFAQGEHALACEFFQQAIEANEPGTSALYSNLSAARLAMGDAAAALDAADECIDHEPGWVKGYYRRGDALLALKEFARAEGAFMTALEMAPDDALIIKKLGELRRRMQQGESARAGMAVATHISSQPAWGRPQPSSVPTPPPVAPVAALVAVTAATTTAAVQEGVVAPNAMESGVGRSTRAGGGEAPPMLRQGGSAFDALRQKKAAKKHAAAASAATEAAQAAEAKQRADDAKANAQYKRCRLCGNVVHKSMNTCTSCCMPLVDLESFDVASLPRAGVVAAAEDDAAAANDDDEEEPLSTLPDNLRADLPTQSSAPTLIIGPTLPPPNYVAQVPATVSQLPPEREERALPSLERWRREMLAKVEAAGDYPAGFDPSLAVHFGALGLPLGSGEADIRKAYRELVVENHPDSGGDVRELERVQRAYDAIADDAAAHDAGAAALLLRLNAEGPSAEQPQRPRIFVSVVSYRDPEAVHTLEDLFEKAAHPERVFVGVVWQYVTALPKNDGGGKVVTRFFTEVNLLTAMAELEAAKLKDYEEQYKYMKKVKKFQTTRQEEEFRSELRSNTAEALPESMRARVRESHVPFHQAEGASYARHLAMRLYGGEEYVMQIDSHMRFAPGWDDELLDALVACDSPQPVLTTYPLQYELATREVLDHEGQLVGKLGVPGDATVPALAAGETRPPVICALKFGPTGLCHFGAKLLAAAPAAPVRTCFFGGMFCFARAEALVVDAPPDVHAPFLNLGDEMSMAARLWTRGWDFFAPHRNIAFHLYKNNYRNLYFNEDRRMGLRLYADEAERYGSLDDFNERNTLKSLSQRRVLHVLGAPHPEASAAAEQVDLGRYAAGSSRSIHDFWRFCGLDPVKRTVKETAVLGGQTPAAFALETSDYLPARWRNGSMMPAPAGAHE